MKASFICLEFHEGKILLGHMPPLVLNYRGHIPIMTFLQMIFLKSTLQPPLMFIVHMYNVHSININ